VAVWTRSGMLLLPLIVATATVSGSFTGRECEDPKKNDGEPGCRCGWKADKGNLEMRGLVGPDHAPMWRKLGVPNPNKDAAACELWCCRCTKTVGCSFTDSPDAGTFEPNTGACGIWVYVLHEARSTGTSSCYVGVQSYWVRLQLLLL